MICESGKVVSVEGPWVWVETFQMSACNSCSAKSGCGQKMLGSVFSGKRHYTKVSAGEMESQVHIGDTVELGIDETYMLKGTFWVYMMPLVVTILSTLLFARLELLASEDLSGLLGAAVGFVGSLVLLRLHAHKNRNNPQYRPVLHRRLSGVSEDGDNVDTASLAVDITAGAR